MGSMSLTRILLLSLRNNIEFYYFINIYMNIKPHTILIILPFAIVLLSTFSLCQVSPAWQATPYIEAKNTIIVSNAQKTFGTYTFIITFSQVFSTAALALGIILFMKVCPRFELLVTQPNPLKFITRVSLLTDSP